MKQGGGPGLRGPSTVPQGGTISVEVATNDTTVEVSSAGSATTSHGVNPDKTARIPVPPVPPSTLLFVSVGTGVGAQVIVVEVLGRG